MKEVTVARRTQFRPQNMMTDTSDEEAKRIDINLLPDPQHATRERGIQSATWLNTKKKSLGLAPPISAWQFRGYQFRVPPTKHNPYNLTVMGPQWEDHNVPRSIESAKSDKYCSTLDWFYGYLTACGFTIDDLYPGLSPHLNFYTFQDWGDLPPMTYRPHSYYMEWQDRNWRNRLATYLVDFAKWADDKIEGPQALMLGTLKRHQVWPVEIKLKRLYQFAGKAPYPKAPMSWWMKTKGYNPATDPSWNTKSMAGSKNVFMFPETTEVDWWYGVCSLPGKVRWRLDRAGLKHWKVITDFGVGDNAWSGYPYIQDWYIKDEADAIDFMWSNAVKAAHNSDIILLDEDHDWYKSHRPWVLEMKESMEERTELVKEISW